MNDRFNRLLQYNTSGLGCWTSLILVAVIVTLVGFKWVINGFLILLALLLVSPVLAFWGLQWWLKRNLVQDACPVCNYEFTGFKQTEFRCPSCGETLRVTGDSFTRFTPPGTIDVNAIEVSANAIEEGN